jgi:hypothetical protein
VTTSLELWPMPERPGRYAAVLPDGRVLVQSRQPLLDGARKLLAEGVPPDTVIETRHEGSTIVAQRTTVGEAAKWTVKEHDKGGLQRKRYEAPDQEKLARARGVRPTSENRGRAD